MSLARAFTVLFKRKPDETGVALAYTTVQNEKGDVTQCLLVALDSPDTDLGGKIVNAPLTELLCTDEFEELKDDEEGEETTEDPEETEESEETIEAAVTQPIS